MIFLDENCKGIIILENGKIMALNDLNRSLNDELYYCAVSLYKDMRDTFVFAPNEKALMEYLSFLGNIVICKDKEFFSLDDNSETQKFTITVPDVETPEQIKKLNDLKDDLLGIDATVYKCNPVASDNNIFLSTKSYFLKDLGYKQIFDLGAQEERIIK